MKKRLLGLVLAFTILIIVPAVSASYKELIFEDWVYHESNFTADGKAFYSTVSPNVKSMSIKYDEEIVIVRINECKEFSRFDVCFDDRMIWYHDMLDRDWYKAKIRLYQKLAKINITRSFSNPNLLIGEETSIDLIFKNSGSSLIASDILYLDEFPSDFMITGFSGCILSGNSIKWTGELKIGERVECSYKIKAMNKITYNSKASIKYFNGDDIVTEYSDAKKLNVPEYSLTLFTNITNSSLDIGGTTIVYTTLKNINDGEDLMVSLLEMQIPVGFKVVSNSGEVKQSGDKMIFTGKLIKGESKTFFISFKPEYTGNYTVKYNAKFEIKGIIQNVSDFSDPINVYHRELAVIRYVPRIIESGKTFAVNISVKNPSMEYQFKNVRVNIVSDMPNMENKTFGIINLLDKEEFRQLFYQEYAAPNMTGEKTYVFKTYASYTTPYNEFVQLEKIDEIKVVGEQITEGVQEENITTENATSIVEEQPASISSTLTLKPFKKKMSTGTMILIVALIITFVGVDAFLLRSIVKRFNNSKEK